MISSNRKIGIAVKRSCFSGLIGSCGLAIALAGVIFPLVATAQITDPIFSPVLGPAVRIISPANHQVFFAPVDIPIFAYTRLDPVGVRFTNVEFYANGTNDLGSGIRLTNTAVAAYKTLASPDVMQPDVIARLRGLWCFVWSNAPAGTYSMTAVATGADIAAIESIVRTSAPVNITVVIPIIPPPEPTNIVSIVATDPIAIAGTNSSWIWPCMTNAVPSWIGWPPTNWMSCTNWGPKAALFTVRRCGDLSTDLLVNYNIGGTASNGVDYVALPGFVDIAAGSAYAHIPIVPTDSGSNNIPKTVVLTLLPSTNTPPDYLPGFPRRAAALILYHWPRPLPWLLPDGSFHFGASAPDGAWFTILDSTDLLNWSCIGTNQVFQGFADFIDPNAPDNSSGFYQIAPLASPPTN